jgi:hypothetical protein
VNAQRTVIFDETEFAETVAAVAKRCGCIAAMHSSPRKSPAPSKGNGGFFPAPGNDGEFDLALLDVIQRIGFISLGKDSILFLQFNDLSPHATFCEESLGIKGSLLTSSRSYGFHYLLTILGLCR